MLLFLVLILLTSPLTLLAQGFSPNSPSNPLSTRLEINDQMRGYFTEEFEMPTSPLASKIHPVSEAEKVKIDASFNENGSWTLHFQFPEKLSVEQELEGDTLLLTFNQSIDSPDLVIVQEKIGYLIKRFLNGFNTLYFVAKRPLSFAVDTCEHSLTLQLIPDFDILPDPTRQLKTTYARLVSEERDFEGATEYLLGLEDEYPGDKDILILHATLEGLLPRWKRELEMFRELHRNHPTDEDVRKYMWEVYTPHSPYGTFQRQMQRSVGLAAVQVYQLQGEDIYSDTPQTTIYCGAKYQLFSGHVLGIVNNQGNTVGFRGLRNQGSLYIRKDHLDGSHETALFYAQEGEVLGVGAEVGLLWPGIQGTFNIAADWHRPYWAVFETLAYHGREDRIMVQVNSLCNRNWNVGLEGGAHRVGITGTADGFTSILASAQVFYNVRVINPIIAFNYGLDAEYILNQTKKMGETGNVYNPVPYVSFENHSLRAYIYYIVRDRWYFSAFAGQTYNRLGINAATFGASVKYTKPEPCGWEVELSATQFPSTTNQGATAQYITGSFTARF